MASNEISWLFLFPPLSLVTHPIQIQIIKFKKWRVYEGVLMCFGGRLTLFEL